MSHVATVDVEVKDLSHLRQACAAIGLEFVEGQKTYKWYGKHVVDYPLPEGFAANELGHCEHAIRVPGNDRAYEIGVVKRRDGRPGWSLLWDFYNGGYGLECLAGKDCRNLRREYARVAAVAAAQQQGFRVQQTRRADGSIRLTLSK